MKIHEDTGAAIRTLELPLKFTGSDLKLARKDQLQIWHPDRFNTNERLRLKAQDRTQKINHAFDILKNLLKGEYFEWVAPSSNEGTNQYNASELGRRNQELQKMLTELQNQHKEEILSLKHKYTVTHKEIEDQHKHSENVLRSELLEKQASLLHEIECLKKTRQKHEAKVLRNQKILAHFSRYFMEPFTSLLSSIRDISITIFKITNDYLKRNLSNRNERVTIISLIAFSTGLSIFIFCCTIPLKFIIVLTCIFMIAGYGRLILATQLQNTERPAQTTPQVPKGENIISENSANSKEQDDFSSSESYTVDQNKSFG